MQGNLLVLFLEGLEAATPPGYSARGRWQHRLLTRQSEQYPSNGATRRLPILRGNPLLDYVELPLFALKKIRGIERQVHIMQKPSQMFYRMNVER